MDRITYGDWGSDIAASFAIPAISAGVFWFILVFILARIGARRASESDTRKALSGIFASGAPGDLGCAALISSVLAVTAWFILTANDEIFVSRSLPWIRPLIWFQWEGFGFASSLFPCRGEGSTLGCEEYNWVPAFLISNAVVYLPFLLPVSFIYRRSPGVRQKVAQFLHSFIRWGSVLGSFGLCLCLLLNTFWPDLFPIRVWSLSNAGYVLLEFGAGVLTLALALLLPFFWFRVLRSVWVCTDVFPTLYDLTWIVAFAVAAITLWYPHDVGWHLSALS